MKCIILLLLPVFGYCQTKLDTLSFLSGKVKILAPSDLKPMSNQMWALKYQNRARPVLVLSDEAGEVNLIADMTRQSAAESQLVSFKDFQIQQLKSKRPDLVLLSNGIKTINGKKVGYIKFQTQAIDQKIFNYYFFTLVDGKILLFTFNCIEKLQKQWESTADQILASLKTM